MYPLYLLLVPSLLPYYYDNRIHSLGNIGIGGKIHSKLSPFATKVIDFLRYDNVNIRKDILSDYSKYDILDLCCGTGMSTMDNCSGVDTSPEMLKVANNYFPNKKFYFGNAENYVPKDKNKYDIVTCMFAMHEMPKYAQKNVIKNAKKLAKKEVIIVDIASNYNDINYFMLKGEPYLLDYLNNIDDILKDFKKTIYIPNRVHIWKLKI